MRNRLIWLIASRLTVLLMLLGTAAILNLLYPATPLLKIFIEATLVVSVLSVIYSVLIKFSPRYKAQAYLQIFVDILLVSAIVYLTAPIEKSFVALYIIVVLASSTVLPRAAVLTTALLCTICYISVIGASYKVYDKLSLLNTDQSAPLYILAILLIGILGGQIAERLRLSHVELTRATQDLANLQAFNQRIIESIHSGLVTTDIEGKILSFNHAAEEITQYKATQTINHAFAEIFGEHSEHLTFGPQLLNISRAIRFTAICPSATGRQMHLGITASPLYSENGTMTGLVLSFQDLTEIIKLEQEIRRRDRLAAMGKMAAGIAHEIRNPLAAMRGSIQVLRSELDLTEDQDYLMQIVLRESDRLDRIVSDFLAYARPSPAKLVAFDLATWIDETVTLLKHSAELTSEHHIIPHCEPTPLLITADPNQMRQIVWNLVRNALQAMPNGGTLKINIRENANKQVEFTFIDNGIGMSETEMERIFEPFNSSRPGGTGLGLAIVYQIVSDHNGKILVESKVNEGTKITVLIPNTLALYDDAALTPAQTIAAAN